MSIPEHMARFIRERDICALCTSRGDIPHASLMSYAVEPELTHILMATPAATRKWANLSAAPAMALLIDEREKVLGPARSAARALTVGGVLDPIEDEAEKERLLTILAARHPHLADFFGNPGMEVIRCKPRWLLLLTGAEHSEFIELEKN